MPRHRNYGSQTSFLDLLFNSLLAFVGFFMLALTVVKEDENKNPHEIPKVEFLATLSWPSDADDDIDIWIVDPLDSIVYFNRKEDGLMHLDRDDVGNKNDEIVLPDGKKFIYKENREIVTLRGFIPGEYCLNLHVFKKRTLSPVTASVKIEKMNPYSTVFAKDIKLADEGQEITVCRFVISSSGQVTSIKDGPPRKLIQKKAAP